MSATQPNPRIINGLQAELAGFMPSLIPGGTLFFARDQGSNGTLYFLSIDAVGVRSWKVIGGIGTGINIQTVTAAGVTNILQNTDIIIADPQGAIQTLRLPVSSLNDQGRMTRLLLVSTGEVTVEASGGDVLWTGAAEFTMTAQGSSATFNPSSRWMLTDAFGAIRDFTVYVSLSGNDDNLGTLADPILTIGEALIRAERLGWTRYALVYLGSGTFIQPAGTGLLIPEPAAANATPLQMIGQELDSGLAPLSVLSYAPPVNADGPIGAVITVSGMPFTLDYRGWRVRMTGGAANGMSFMVAANPTTSTLMICDLYTTLAMGDTFVLERPDTTLSFSALTTPVVLFPVISGSPLMLRSLEIKSTAQRLFIQETQVYAQHVWIDVGVVGFRALSVFGGGEFYAGVFSLGWFGLRSAPGFDPRALDRTGVYVRGLNALNGIEARENGIVRLAESVCLNASVFGINDSFVEFGTSIHYDLGFVGLDFNGGSCSAYASQWTNSNPGSGRGALHCKEGTVTAYACGFDGVTGSAMKFMGGSTADVTGCVGMGNTLYGLEVRSGSKCQISMAIANSVIGGSGQVRVGASFPVTWAAAFANANDLASAGMSELCWTGP